MVAARSYRSDTRVVEVLVVWRCHRFEAEVINDEQRCFDKGLEPSFVSIDSPCCVKLSEQFGLRCEEDVVAVADGDVSEGLRDVTLSGATRSGDQNGDLLLNEAASGKVADERLVHVRVESEVKAFQCFLTSEAGAPDARRELLALPARDFILDKQGEELRVGEFTFDGFLVSVGQALEKTGEVQPLKHGCQFGHGVHLSFPF